MREYKKSKAQFRKMAYGYLGISMNFINSIMNEI